MRRTLTLLALLFLPLPLPERAALALAVGPAVGLIVHLTGMRTRQHAQTTVS